MHVNYSTQEDVYQSRSVGSGQLLLDTLSNIDSDKNGPDEIETTCAGSDVTCCIFIEPIQTNCQLAPAQMLS